MQKPKGVAKARTRTRTTGARARRIHGARTRRSREESLAHRGAEISPAAFDACGMGLDLSVAWSLELERGAAIFKVLASCCGSFESAGRALAWAFFNFSTWPGLVIGSRG